MLTYLDAMRNPKKHIVKTFAIGKTANFTVANTDSPPFWLTSIKNLSIPAKYLNSPETEISSHSTQLFLYPIPEETITSGFQSEIPLELDNSRSGDGLGFFRFVKTTWHFLAVSDEFWKKGWALLWIIPSKTIYIYI